MWSYQVCENCSWSLINNRSNAFNFFVCESILFCELTSDQDCCTVKK